MNDAGIARYRRWFEYECDAQAKVFASLETVPADRRDAPEYRRALSLLGHLIAARRIWLVRLGLGGEPPRTFFPEDVGLAELVADWGATAARWADFLAKADDDTLGREFEYRSLDAGRFRNRIEDILAQLFGHSWYHRGQIAMLVRACGGEPAITDLIYWCRESVDA